MRIHLKANARLLRAAGSPGQEAPCGGAGVSLQMDSHSLSLLEGARGLRRERLPGSFGQAQLAAGGSNQGGVVRNMCETCGEEVNFPWGKSISYLTALLRNLPTLWRFNGAGIGWPQRLGMSQRF